MRIIVPQFIRDRYEDDEFQGHFQAASLFVDISGFTALTELLMGYGKAGAEVLTDALNSVFEPLVQAVYRHGGFVSHFAGDAFTALFPIRRHHAVSYAAQMAFYVQDFFRNSGRIDTQYGTITLGAKCGLSLGQVTWGIVGSEDRYTYYFRGEAIDGCSDAEHLAEQGEIVATKAFAANAPSALQTIARTECCRLLSHEPFLPLKRSKLRHAPLRDREPFIHAKGLEEEVVGEFREIASVFISVDETMKTEAFNSFISDTLRLAELYRGYFNRLAFGDKGCVILVLFGAPVSFENNVERAADFLLAIPQSVRWRAGIAFGPVYAGFVGGKRRSEYTAMGDTVNLAARLMTGASWGTIWVGENIARWLAHKGYQLEQMDTIRFKGKKKAVSVSRLSMTPRSLLEAPSFRANLFGRQPELSTIKQALIPIFAGRFAGVISVHGDAGVGKSHLVHELHNRVHEKRPVGWLGCRADGVLRQALNPFRVLLRHYFDQSNDAASHEKKERFLSILKSVASHAPDELRSELERTSSFLGALIGLFWPDSLFEHVDASLRRQNTYIALKTLILTESLRHPTVIQIDDLHHVDPESLEFIQFLTRNVDSYPFAILTTTRYNDDGSRVMLDLAETIPRIDVDLGCLTPVHVAHLAQDILQGPVSARLSDFLTAKTGGNPFFAEQLLLDLQERSALQVDDSGTWDIIDQRAVEIPSTVNAVLIARLDRLTAQIKTIVQTAAVLGQEFQVQVLSEMLKDNPDVPAIIRRAEGEAIWSPISEIRYIFRHALLRDAAYDMQLRTRLRRLHELAASAMEVVFADDISTHYADLAFHYRHAAISERERVYARLAGLQLRDRSNFREAREFLNRVLELLSPEDDAARCEILRALVDISISTGDYRQAEQRAQEALDAAEGCNDQLAAAHAIEAMGTIALKHGGYEAAKASYEQSLGTYSSLGERAGVATSLMYIGLVHHRMGDVDRATDALQRSCALSEEIGDRRGVAACSNALGDIRYRQGNYADARSYFEKSLDICRALGDRMRTAQALSNLATVTSAVGEDDVAQPFYEESFQIQQEIGDQYGCAVTLNNLAFFPYAKGDHAAAERLVEESLRLAQGIENPYIVSMNLNNMGMFAALQQEFPRARDHFEASLEVSRKLGDPQAIAHTLCGLASALLELGQVDDAENRLRESLTVAKDAQATPVVLEALLGIADVYHRRGLAEYSAKLMGQVEAHPATESEVRQSAAQKLRTKLTSALLAEDVERLAAQGASTDLNTVVSEVLDRGASRE